MSRGAGTATETLGIGFLGGVVFTVLLGALGPCQPDPSPKDQADHNCEQAWVDQSDGDPDTHPAPIINEPWCQAHNATAMADQAQETP